VSRRGGSVTRRTAGLMDQNQPKCFQTGGHYRTILPTRLGVSQVVYFAARITEGDSRWVMNIWGLRNLKHGDGC
jgi:hypothetical protein